MNLDRESDNPVSSHFMEEIPSKGFPQQSEEFFPVIPTKVFRLLIKRLMSPANYPWRSGCRVSAFDENRLIGFNLWMLHRGVVWCGVV